MPKKSKKVKSSLSSKSTAKLNKEISSLLEQKIPDPDKPLAEVFSWEPEDEETKEKRERKFEENYADHLDIRDQAREEDEDSRRY